ncbi:MAG: M20/M25/M40 family metallo-hydrolase [Clostridia bacterium]|nr:M20/M25/M40 family metallo-hydrolase [Clostridia bacterium]
MTYAEKLSKMIQCETISQKGEKNLPKFYAFHKVLEELFPRVHAKMEKRDFEGSLMFYLKGTGEKAPLMLMSHMDVVEATGNWTHDAFSGHIDDKRIWGRGTLDTKGSLFALMQAAEEMLENDMELPFDLYLVTSCTEEVGGEGGIAMAKYLKDNGIKLGLLIDEGGAIMEEPIKGAKGRFAMIGVIEKGGGNLKIIARSKGGHSSTPPKNTPIARLAKFISHIEKHDPFRAELSPQVKKMLEVLSTNMEGPLGLVIKNQQLTAPLIRKVMPMVSPTAGAMLKTTIVFTMQSGSQGANVLPQEAYVVANLRYIPHQNRDESVEIIKKIAKKFDLEVEVMSGRPATRPTDINGAGYKYVEKTLNKVFPDVIVSPYVMVGGTDSRFYADVTKDIIRFAPIFMDDQQYASIHGENENVFIDVLPKAVEFYKEIIKGY